MRITLNFNWAAIIFAVLLTLKLTDVIDWSWWWITSPLWISAILALIIFAIASIFIGEWRKTGSWSDLNRSAARMNRVQANNLRSQANNLRRR